MTNYLMSCPLSQSALFHWQKKKKKCKQARIKLIHKAKGMDVAVITVNTSGQKVSSTSALGLYNGSAPRDIKGEA